jgi:diguanylate cyclase (GGDEF)-like protein/PAS domain S-box-containing protein
MQDMFYRQIVEESPVGYVYGRIICDEAGIPFDYEWLDVNAAFELLTGLKRDDIIGKKRSQVLPAVSDGQTDWVKFYGEIALSGKRRELVEYSGPVPRWYRINAYSPQPGYFISLFTDIAKEMSTVDELEKFFSVNLDLLCIADMDGNFVRLNKQWEHVLGYTVDELQKQKFMDFVHPEDVEATLHALEGLRENEQVLDFVNRYGCKDGSYRYIEWRSQPHGDLIYSAARDITAKVREQQDVQRIVETAERFLQFYGDHVDYQWVTDELLYLSEADYVAFNLYDEEGRNYTTVALSGISERLTRTVSDILGHRVLHRRWPHGPLRAANIKGSTIVRFSSLYSLAGDVIPKVLSDLVQRATGIGEIVVVKIVKDDILIGDFALFMKRGRAFAKDHIVEMYAKQLGMLLTRTRAEERLRESEATLRAAQKIAKLGHWEQRHPTKNQYWTDPLYDIYEVDKDTPEDLLYQTFSDLVHPEDRDRVDEVWSAALKNRVPYELTHRVLMKDGRAKWVYETGETLYDEQGQPVRTVGIVQDITERKAAEELVRESEEKYRRIADNVSDVVWTTDLELNTTFVSPSVERVLYETVELHMQRPLGKKFPPDSLRVIMEMLREELVLENDPAADKARTRVIELEHYRGDGSLVWLAMHVSFLRDEKGRAIGLQGVSRDITDVRARQAEVEFLSFHDVLTGLYNRRFFEEELKRLDKGRNLPLTMCIIDVNGLKLINDAFGHQAGDNVLRRVAAAMKRECRGDDIIARIGGDEFVILLPKTSSAQAQSIAKRVSEAVSRQMVESVILSVSYGLESKVHFGEEMEVVFKKAEDDLYRRKLSESNSMRHMTIEVIMNTLHEKNARERQHAHRVSQLCGEMGEALDLSPQEVRELRTAGLMHDIGKIALDDRILNKTDPLDDAEWLVIKRHPEIGYRILSSVNAYAPLAEYVLAHQERWDGKGYPKGLTGEDIPFAARIIAVADAYDAMITNRPYRKAMSKAVALEELARHAGTQFDPHLVRVFVELVQN